MVVASIVLLVLIFYLQYQFMADATGQVRPEDIILQRLDLVNVMGASFPPAIWATRAISAPSFGESLANFAYLATISAMVFGAFMMIGQKAFFGGLLGGSERVRRGQVFTESVLAKTTVSTSPAKALLLREVRLFLRMPIWVMNGFLTVILFPMMAFFPSVFGATGETDAIFAIAREHPAAAALIFAAIIAAMTALNTLASTAISREGKFLWISKTLPVKGSQMLTAKLTFALTAALLSSIPLMGVYGYMMRPGVAYMLLAFLIGIVAGFTPQVLGLWFDLWRPFLTWTNPQHAVKNNLNAVSPLIVAIPLGYLTYLAYEQLLPLGPLVALPAILVVHSVLAITASVALYTQSGRLYADLEVKG